MAFRLALAGMFLFFLLACFLNAVNRPYPWNDEALTCAELFMGLLGIALFFVCIFLY